MTSTEILRQFMGKMDRLWKRFDQAVDKLPSNDAFAFKRYSEYLDEFFVCYWQVFNETSQDIKPDELVRTADAQCEESMRLLELTWRNTTDALLRRAVHLKDSKSKARSLPQLLAHLQKAERLLNELRRDDNINTRISGHVEAAGVLEEFIRKVESAN